jgi:biotin carboxyl carrier protein
VVIRKVLVDGKPLQVSLGANGAYRIDGREGEISIVEVEPGVYSVLMDGRSFEVRSHDGTVWVNGSPFDVEVEDPRAPKRRKAGSAVEGQQVMKAAMPGKVVRVLVRVGDEVSAGQGVAVVEAMKMQNEVKARAAGKVLSIAVREGAAVAGGDVLAVIG